MTDVMREVDKKRKASVQERASDIIGHLERERKAGTGPHTGPHGPLVKSHKQIQAIAYSKARRGES